MKRILLLALVITSNIYSQNLDSLLVVARKTKNDSIKIRMFNKVAFSYIFNDTNKALLIIKEGIALAENKKFYFGLAELTNTHGIYMDITGKSDSANYFFTKALKLSKQYKFNSIEAGCTNNLGMFNWNIGNYQKALDYFFEALRMNDEFGEERTRHIYLNNIGLIYQEMLLADKALEYHQEAYFLRLKYDDKTGQATSLNNIGICYKTLGELEKAEETYKRGLEMAKISKNLRDYHKILDNLGSVYQLQNKFNEAIESYLKALNVPEKLGVNRRAELITISNLIKAYNEINKPQKAFEYGKKSLVILEEYPQYKSESDELFLHIAETNYILGNIKTARLFTEQFVQIKDSIFSEQNAKAIADLEVQYNTENKEKEILTQRASLVEKELNLNRKNTQIIGLGILAVVISILGYLLFNQQKLKNSQLKKESELKEALVKIETQNRLQNQRLRISRDLHDNIGAQLTFIISSIENLQYGFKIKNEKLTNKLSSISTFTKETIYELRDTIWAMNKNAVSLEDLQVRISNFIEKADISSSSINFEFNIDESISKNMEFTSVEGMNIYRVIQEAINNAIKYADASKVNVHIKEVDKSLQFLIEDNGKGFNENEIAHGNGLHNMKKRAKEISATIKIESNLDTGTNVFIILPL